MRAQGTPSALSVPSDHLTSSKSHTIPLVTWYWPELRLVTLIAAGEIRNSSLLVW